MKKILLSFLLFYSMGLYRAQSLYFPPISGNTWDTMSPQSLNWCQFRIDSLYNYLQVKNTKSFIVLKNGKIVLEKYFGTYTADSLFYWASASKSLAGFITGIAQQKGYIQLNNKVSQYLGTGWTSAPLAKENLITVKHLLSMTAGLDDLPPSPCDHLDTAKVCLIYKADAGTRWGYHTGAYRKVQDVVSATVGLNYNTITNNWIESKTGMSGFWFDQIYYSKARDMARFGLLNLNKGIWGTDTLLKDSLFFKDMINSSQTLNEAYGYLWWLNGKPTFMTPQVQFTFSGTLMPNAPNDMYCALGKNDQKIYVVPSQKLVVIRQGNSAGGFNLAASAFDNVLWDYINKLNCTASSLTEQIMEKQLMLYPNPASNKLSIRYDQTVHIRSISAYNMLGQEFSLQFSSNEVNISHLPRGMYSMSITLANGQQLFKKVCLN